MNGVHCASGWIHLWILEFALARFEVILGLSLFRVVVSHHLQLSYRNVGTELIGKFLQRCQKILIEYGDQNHQAIETD